MHNITVPHIIRHHPGLSQAEAGLQHHACVEVIHSLYNNVITKLGSLIEGGS